MPNGQTTDQNDESEINSSYLINQSTDSATIQTIKRLVRSNKKLKNIPNPSSSDSVDWRIDLISVVAKYLVYELSTDYMPTKSMKIDFAKAIIETFPFLKNEKLKDGYVC